jgi:dynein heavy chain
MQKDFQPYSNLWLTTDHWFNHIKHWMEDPFESIDADECERFIEESVRLLNQVIRYFR